jgi:hypothetical protein
MFAIKYLSVSALLLISLSAFSQNKNQEAVFLKWKLQPNEVISYKTTMQEIDTANHRDLTMDGLIKSAGIDENAADFQKVFKQLNKEAQFSNFITYLKKNPKNTINVDLYLKDTTVKSINDTGKMADIQHSMQEMMAKMNKGIMLRGVINEDGTIESFYTKNDQKNLIAALFELPGRSVKLGDTWAIDVHFLSMDQNFKCDSSFRRDIVKVVAINNTGNEHIVTLKYDILEYVSGDFNSPFGNNSPMKTSMKMTHIALANFSIEKGRWISYDGVMALSATGMMAMQTTKKISLVLE